MDHSNLVSLGLVAVLSALVIGGAVLARRRAADPSALSRRLLEHRWPVAFIASGALIALTGAGMVVHAALVTHVAVDLADAERGAPVDAELATVEGYPRLEAIVCRRGRSGEQCHTPITSAPDGTVVAALVAQKVRSPGHGRWTGFVTRSDAASFRRAIEERGLASVDAPFRVIAESRATRSRAGSWVTLAGAGLLSAGWLWLRRKRAR